jgi:hypothetical protein
MTREDEEAIATLAKVARAKERLRKQANPEPVNIPSRRTILEVNTHVGAGTDRTKERRKVMLTTAERMYYLGKSLSYDEFAAAGILRNKYLTQLGENSEGVASYGDAGSRTEPWGKGDAKAHAILRRNRTKLRELADLMWSIAGHYNEEGDKVFDKELLTLVVRSVIETTDAVTQEEVARARTNYKGEKQTQAAGGAILKECYRRAAAHLRFIKVQEWRDSRWRVVEP